jgi:hypothetical protein
MEFKKDQSVWYLNIPCRFVDYTNDGDKAIIEVNKNYCDYAEDCGDFAFSEPTILAVDPSGIEGEKPKRLFGDLEDKKFCLEKEIKKLEEREKSLKGKVQDILWLARQEYNLATKYEELFLLASQKTVWCVEVSSSRGFRKFEVRPRETNSSSIVVRAKTWDDDIRFFYEWDTFAEVKIFPNKKLAYKYFRERLEQINPNELDSGEIQNYFRNKIDKIFPNYKHHDKIVELKELREKERIEEEAKALEDQLKKLRGEA